MQCNDERLALRENGMRWLKLAWQGKEQLWKVF
jgi:hypothetical protein